MLALAPEVEAFRGKGSQIAAREFTQQTAGLAYRAKERLQQSVERPELFLREAEVAPEAGDVLECLGMLADHAFERVRGAPVRSRHAGVLRATAWHGLALIAEIRRRPGHLEHALKVAADAKASNEEREGAVEFLVAYWDEDDPDEATVAVLSGLQARPGNRRLLVTVMQAQIDLGIGDEFGALMAVEDWDRAWSLSSPDRGAGEKPRGSPRGSGRGRGNQAPTGAQADAGNGAAAAFGHSRLPRLYPDRGLPSNARCGPHEGGSLPTLLQSLPLRRGKQVFRQRVAPLKAVLQLRLDELPIGLAGARRAAAFAPRVRPLDPLNAGGRGGTVWTSRSFSGRLIRRLRAGGRGGTL